VVLIAISETSASIPCLAKMPSSRATIAEAQSLVAVQAIFSLNASASAVDVVAKASAVVTKNEILRRTVSSCELYRWRP
jgi:hypothetical protein